MPGGLNASAADVVPGMTDVKDFNQQIIDEFRANGGKVGGRFEGAPLLLLHSTGAKSGRERVNPVTYRRDGDHLVIFGTKAGAPTNPDWYHNLVANPRAKVEVGTTTLEVVALVAEGEERERLWNRQKQDVPPFADYEQQATRQIPVVILEPAA
jgi:deazaflavin-dependent oxidoreductase (nitroreductase family)